MTALMNGYCEKQYIEDVMKPEVLDILNRADACVRYHEGKLGIALYFDIGKQYNVNRECWFNFRIMSGVPQWRVEIGKEWNNYSGYWNDAIILAYHRWIDEQAEIALLQR